MARQAHDPQEEQHAPRPARREPSTDRLGTPTTASDPVNPNWRSTRSANRGRRAASVPLSRQDFALWLQYGGWRFLLIAAALVILGGGLFALSQPAPGPLPRTAEEPTADLVARVTPRPLQPTVTASAATPPPAAAPAAQGARFRVTGTGAEGLFLRPEPNTAQPPLKTLPEGSVVTIIGEDTVAADRVWKRVRDESGAEGWAASDFLSPAE
jgi:hypothetical protein